MTFDRSLLTFDPPHIHRYNGKRLLGVTTALSAISKGDGLTQWAVNCACDYARANLVPEATVDDPAAFAPLPYTADYIYTVLMGAKSAWRTGSGTAATIGTIAHNWIEAYLKGEDPPWPDSVPATRACEAAVEWIRSVSWETIAVEKQIYLPELEVAGICDWYVKINGVPAILDWKTSKALHSTYAYQTAAYLRALENELGVEIPHRWLIRIDKETGVVEPKFLPQETIAADYDAFVSAVKIYKREAEIKKQWLSDVIG